jgi:hypothetical protein
VIVKAMTNVDQNDLININHHHLRNAPSPNVCSLRPGCFDSAHSSLGLIGGNLRYVCLVRPPQSYLRHLFWVHKPRSQARGWLRCYPLAHLAE